MNPEELYEKYSHLAEVTIHRMFPSTKIVANGNGIDVEDLYQYARLALWESSVSYNESKGKRSFQTYAITYIKWKVLESIRKDCKKFSCRGTGINPKDLIGKVKFISLDDKPSNGEDDFSTYHELISNDYNLEGEVIGTVLKEYIDETSPRTLQFLNLKMNGETTTSIAKRYGISHQAVSISVKKLGKKLKEVI